MCVWMLLVVPPEDIKALPEREDWKAHAEEGGIITSLPVLFENLVVEILLSLKEVIVESLPGEPKVWWEYMEHGNSCAFSTTDEQ